MQSSPDYFLQEKNLNFQKDKIEQLSDLVNKITYELAKNTKEI
jgi:hypothetical protein